MLVYIIVFRLSCLKKLFCCVPYLSTLSYIITGILSITFYLHCSRLLCLIFFRDSVLFLQDAWPQTVRTSHAKGSKWPLATPTLVGGRNKTCNLRALSQFPFKWQPEPSLAACPQFSRTNPDQSPSFWNLSKGIQHFTPVWILLSQTSRRRSPESKAALYSKELFLS